MKDIFINLELTVFLFKNVSNKQYNEIIENMTQTIINNFYNTQFQNLDDDNYF